jgi:hypothetical protein
MAEAARIAEVKALIAAKEAEQAAHPDDPGVAGVLATLESELALLEAEKGAEDAAHGPAAPVAAVAPEMPTAESVAARAAPEVKAAEPAAAPTAPAPVPAPAPAPGATGVLPERVARSFGPRMVAGNVTADTDPRPARLPPAARPTPN